MRKTKSYTNPYFVTMECGKKGANMANQKLKTKKQRCGERGALGDYWRRNIPITQSMMSSASLKSPFRYATAHCSSRRAGARRSLGGFRRGAIGGGVGIGGGVVGGVGAGAASALVGEGGRGGGGGAGGVAGASSATGSGGGGGAASGVGATWWTGGGSRSADGAARVRGRVPWARKSGTDASGK